MRKISIVLALLLGSFQLSCVTTVQHQPPKPRVTISPLFDGNVYKRLAVFVIDQTSRFSRSRSGSLRQVEDEFMRVVIERGYTLAARSDVDRIVEEQKLQRSDLTEGELAEIGHILNVTGVLVVSVNQVSTERYQPLVAVQGRNYYYSNIGISARLISVELGEVLWISSYTGAVRVGERSREAEGHALVPIARIVASGLPERVEKKPSPRRTVAEPEISSGR